jgi:RNA polymerase sigma factor (TIGR02999 family)
MADRSQQELTRLLQAWGSGDQDALDSLMPLVYDELRRLAHRYMKSERAGHTLQTTALVNEAYIRLIDVKGVSWQGRAHFFAISARLMRRILVDFARSRQYAKRGAGAQRVSLDEALLVSDSSYEDVLALDEALGSLASMDGRKGQVVELRFFGGLSVEETAEVLQVSPETVLRDWRLAKAWLVKRLKARE